MAERDVPDSSWLAPTSFVDSDHPDVVAFAVDVCREAGAMDDVTRAKALFVAVRERLRYDPVSVSPDPDEYRASTVLRRELQAFDGAGRRYMEYVRDRGLFADLPFDTMLRAFTETYTASAEAAPRDAAFDH
jgi:hypothetical protein